MVIGMVMVACVKGDGCMQVCAVFVPALKTVHSLELVKMTCDKS